MSSDLQSCNDALCCQESVFTDIALDALVMGAGGQSGGAGQGSNARGGAAEGRAARSGGAQAAADRAEVRAFLLHGDAAADLPSGAQRTYGARVPRWDGLDEQTAAQADAFSRRAGGSAAVHIKEEAGEEWLLRSQGMLSPSCGALVGCAAAGGNAPALGSCATYDGLPSKTPLGLFITPLGLVQKNPLGLLS